MNNAMDFTFLDMKLLSQLSVLLVLWMQFIKEYIPKPWRKAMTIVSGISLYWLITNIDNVYAQVLLYGITAAAGGGLGYKVLQSGRNE